MRTRTHIAASLAMVLVGLLMMGASLAILGTLAFKNIATLNIAVSAVLGVAGAATGVVLSVLMVRLQRKRVRIFIAHSHVNLEQARQIAQFLQRKGYSPRLGEDEIHVGDNIRRRIQELTVRCDLIILLLSSDWRQSNWISYEIDLARRLSKRILPVVLDGASLPSNLAELRYLEFRATDDDAMAKLEGAIRRFAHDGGTPKSESERTI